MLLAKLPCLDKGYVALIDTCNNSTKIKEIMGEYRQAQMPLIEQVCSMTLLFKCPLFVQLHLSSYGFTIVNLNVDGLEAYCPNEGEIMSSTAENNRLIAEDISRTTDALLINPSAYATDGCDSFVSQVICPVSTYTTILVHGSLSEWKKYSSQIRVPGPMQHYVHASAQLLRSEFMLR